MPQVAVRSTLGIDRSFEHRPPRATVDVPLVLLVYVTLCRMTTTPSAKAKSDPGHIVRRQIRRLLEVLRTRHRVSLCRERVKS